MSTIQFTHSEDSDTVDSTSCSGLYAGSTVGAVLPSSGTFQKEGRVGGLDPGIAPGNGTVNFASSMKWARQCLRGVNSPAMDVGCLKPESSSAAAKNHRYEARIYPDSGLVLALELDDFYSLVKPISAQEPISTARWGGNVCTKMWTPPIEASFQAILGACEHAETIPLQCQSHRVIQKPWKGRLRSTLHEGSVPPFSR
ncbi:hypothetical protein FA13DRAFT_1712848 [Coprinellus micaceus]|uniref:Uncharacterized protein n=1 Tax=Coprinellus micaceus TaxID=71717 RepID=A0A4Y7SZ06_COPMI|nr:hypothetical protein FA13DRAFT_1712848 [Coprinellus micaceus]